MEKAELQIRKSVWYGPDMVHREDEWLFNITPQELEELVLAADKLVELSSATPDSIDLRPLENLDEEFQLTLLKEKVTKFLEILHTGLGFFVWRGLPVGDWSYRRSAAAFLIISKCMGNFRSQNSKGHVIGHVKDLGSTTADLSVRSSQTTEPIDFHTDFCDVFGLLCLKNAKSGGQSSLVSAGTIFNEMLTTSPNLLPELIKPVEIDRRRGQVPVGGLPYYKLGVYTVHNGRVRGPCLSVSYVRAFIESARRFPGVPPLTPNQIAALDSFDNLANDSRLKFVREFQPGDMLFVNNHEILHARTSYVDWEEESKKRHLLRVYLAPPGARELPVEWADYFGSVEVGKRGGLNCGENELNGLL